MKFVLASNTLKLVTFKKIHTRTFKKQKDKSIVCQSHQSISASHLLILSWFQLFLSCNRSLDCFFAEADGILLTASSWKCIRDFKQVLYKIMNFHVFIIVKCQTCQNNWKQAKTIGKQVKTIEKTIQKKYKFWNAFDYWSQPAFFIESLDSWH